MADTKITGLLSPQVTTNPATDVLPIVNIADTLMASSGSTRKITVNQLLGAGGTATLASATISGDLTVRTNKLAVTSTGVGIGTATPTAGILLDVVGGTFARFNKGAANQYHLRIGNSAKDYGLYVDIDNNGTNGFSFYDITAAADVMRYVPGASGSWVYYINGVQALAINSNAALILKGGSASASGVGVTFPATQVASSDANTLDDYEEGTWTPTIKGSSTAGAGTYSVQIGTYTKVGRVVHFQGRLTWSAHTGTGDMQIAALPFTSLSTSNSNSPCIFGYVNNTSLTASNILTAFVFPGTNDIGLYQYPSGGGAAGSVVVDTAADIIFSGTYFV
jgi:hypothetical protein